MPSVSSLSGKMKTRKTWLAFITFAFNAPKWQLVKVDVISAEFTAVNKEVSKLANFPSIFGESYNKT